MAEQSTTTTETEPTAESHEFKAETKALLNLVINSLYTHKEVFLRELISNASDALDKARLRSLTEHELLGDDTELEIWITPDEEAGTLTISDSGVGMTKAELMTNLGTIAKSGSAEFVKHLTGDATADANLIGQFGVGFYSSFLVADRVTVTSRGAGTDESWRWESSGEGEFSIQPAETRERRGTDIVLHVRDEQKEFLAPFAIRGLVEKYSDFVGHPIKLISTKTEGEGETAATATSTEVINKGSAIWTRPKSEITDEQYNEFYKHTSHDWEDPTARTHFTIEGTQLFTGLLFVPKKPPFNMFMREFRSGVKLYVKRVFVMDECDAILPEYLRFVRGVIDSDDLPLNVSREVLQQDRLVDSIKKQATKKSLEMLAELADERPDDYATFWEGFGQVLKEGLHSDHANQERLSKLLRFASSEAELTSLADYVSRMKEGQEHIYFISGPDKDFLSKSPHIEGLKAKGYEVLYFTDPVDEWVAMSVTEFDGKKVVSAMKGEMNLDADDEEKAEGEDEAKTDDLTKAMKEALGDKVQDVRLTERLTESPVCLVSGAHDPGANLERILKANTGQAISGKRTLEVNAKHPLIANLRKLFESGEHGDRVRSWTELLHDQALLTEGSPIADPAAFARRMNDLMLEISKGALET